MIDAQADQQAAARREAYRELRALHDGQGVTVRTFTVEITPDETEALGRGEVPPAVQAQIDRQAAEDEGIAAIEASL